MNFFTGRVIDFSNGLPPGVIDSSFPIEFKQNLSAPLAQSGERPTAEPTGSESPVRAASRARYSLLTGMACDLWERSHYRPEEVSERGGPCPAFKGTLNVRLNSAVDPKFPDRAVEVRTCATSTA